MSDLIDFTLLLILLCGIGAILNLVVKAMALSWPG
jgi:hypothetical protein